MLRIIGPVKNKLKFFLVFLLVSIFSFFVSNYPFLNYVLLAIALLGLTLVMLGTLAFAVHPIFKSLFAISGGFTLTIFLAQEYCKVPFNPHTLDSSVKSLVIIGLFYTSFLFLSYLYKELMGNPESGNQIGREGVLKTLKTMNKGKPDWFIITLYVLFFVGLLSQLFQVMKFIVLNLCVF
jgi:hypothetical protein